MKFTGGLNEMSKVSQSPFTRHTTTFNLGKTNRPVSQLTLFLLIFLTPFCRLGKTRLTCEPLLNTFNSHSKGKDKVTTVVKLVKAQFDQYFPSEEALSVQLPEMINMLFLTISMLGL